MLNHRYPVTVRGRQLWLVNNLRAWLLFERRTGRQIGDVNGGAEIIRSLLWAFLQDQHSDIDEQWVGGCTTTEFREILQVLELAIRGDFPDIPAGEPSAEPRRLNWYELWAVGRYDLHLSEDEFWSLSPRQFHALTERHDARLEREYTLPSIIHNALGGEGSEPVTPRMFFKGEVEQPVQKSESLMSKIREVASFLPGKFGKLEAPSGT